MASLRRYRISVIVLLSLLAISSGTSVYLYQLRQSDLNKARSADLDRQIGDLNNQVANISIQLELMIANGNSSQAGGVKAEIAKLLATIDSLNAINAAQALEIQNLKVQIQQLQAEIAKLLNPTVLNGAGASFPSLFLSAVMTNYTRTHLGVQMNYQSIGSGAGIKALTSLTVDFAASDAPLTPAQVTAMPGQPLIIPETVGAVVIAYNVMESDGVTRLPSGLNLNSTIAAKIFSGQITTWNDPGIQALNPSLASVLPNKPITVVHRADGSGTTFVFTGYLNSASNGVWPAGQGTSVPWPVGLGVSGSQGMVGFLLGTSYTIGYVELAFALTNPMQYASVQNADGNNFVRPSLTSVTYAVQNATGSTPLPQGNQSWASVSLLNAKGQDSYPIVSFSYLIVYKELSILPDLNLDKTKALVDFLWFTIHNGQTLGPPLAFVPLSANVVAIDEASITSMTFNGQTLPT